MIFQDIFTQSIEDKITSAIQLPYFEGDFWPNIIEESIREINQEEEERKKTEALQAAEAAENVDESQTEDLVSISGPI